MILTIQQLTFLDKVNKLHHDGAVSFRHDYPILVVQVLRRGEYDKDNARFLNQIGEMYKEWVRQEKIDELWKSV